MEGSAAPGDPAGPPNDPTIPDELRLFRRVPARWVKDETDLVISSQAFNDSSDGSGMSVWIEDRMNELGLTQEDARLGQDDVWLAVITVGAVRALGYGVIRTETADEPAHCEVTGSFSTKRRGRVRDAVSEVLPPTP